MNLKTKMYILNFVGVLFFILIGVILLKTPFLILIEIAYVIIFLLLRIIIFNKSTIKIAKKFASNCDPDDYIKDVNNTYYQKNKNSKFFKNVYTALGYSYKGEIKQALEILQNTKTITVSSYNEYLYHSILSRIYFDNGDVEKGKKSFEILEKINLHNKQQQQSKNETLKIRKSQMLFLENNISKSLELEKTINAYSKLENVLKNYRLALIYLKLNKKNEAIPYLKFVVENGNKLNLVKISNKNLEDIKNEK